MARTLIGHCVTTLATDSTESDRMQMIFNISQFDLFDSYLPAYKVGFTNVSHDGGDAVGAMCSYAGINGIPMVWQRLQWHWCPVNAHGN